jgi:hypothetical protein
MPRYNSAISSSLASYGYTAAVVNKKFLYGNNGTDAEGVQFKPWQSTPLPNLNNWDPVVSLFNMQKVALDGHTLVNRSKIDCLRVYTNVYGDRTNLLMVTGDATDDEAPTVLQYTYVAATRDESQIYWPCSDGSPSGGPSNWDGGPDCGKIGSVTASNLDRWTKFGHHVLYCLSEELAGDHCRLNYSPAVMISTGLPTLLTFLVC